MQTSAIIIQDIDTLPKSGHSAFDIGSSTCQISGDGGEFRILKLSEHDRCLQFRIFGKKMRELFDKKEKKEKGKKKREKLLIT